MLICDLAWRLAVVDNHQYVRFCQSRSVDAEITAYCQIIDIELSSLAERAYLIEYFVIALVLPAPVEVSQPVISIFINIDKMVHQFRVFLFFDLAKKKRKKLEVKDTHKCGICAQPTWKEWRHFHTVWSGYVWVWERDESHGQVQEAKFCFISR